MLRDRLYRLRTGQRGLSLIEEIVAVALIGVVSIPVLLGLSSLMRGTADSEAQVRMVALARSQAEVIKQAPFSADPTASPYPSFTPVPEGLAISITVATTTTYAFPPPDASSLQGEVQRVTVEVSCPDCGPRVEPVSLEQIKARR